MHEPAPVNPEEPVHDCCTTVWQLAGSVWVCTECGDEQTPVYSNAALYCVTGRVDFNTSREPVYPSDEAREICEYYSLTSADAFQAYWDAYSIGERQALLDTFAQRDTD